MKHFKELGMINAALDVVNYMSEHRRASDEEILKFAIKNIRSSGMDKLAAIAAANEALKLKKSSNSLNDKQIVQEITNNLFHIISKVES